LIPTRLMGPRQQKPGCPVPGGPLLFGNRSCRFTGLVLGQEPGPNEHEDHCPFVGAAGAFLRVRLLKLLGGKADRVFLTNVSAWCPSCLRKQKPTQQQQRAWLQQDVAAFRDDLQVVLALGQTAVREAAAQRIPIRQAVKKRTLVPKQGLFPANVIIVPAYHPSFILLRAGGVAGSKYSEWERAIMRFKEGL
jgi:uracil-DNA glycosylase family 4